MSKREIDELEVDLTAPKPLNKKQKRLLKKGKISEPEPDNLNKQQPKPRSPYCVWIGNLPFDTTADTLRQFLVQQTSGSKTPVTEQDITRLKLPPKKGFAYVDIATEDQMKSIIALSETRLDQRNLLIKDGRSFEGRPEKDRQNHPASRILFVGNLSFETTDAELEMHFQHCGEISRIRTATFMDSGKCKGFSFIDFTSEEAATKALKDPRCKRLGGRTLRMEYGEDRSQRRPTRQASSSETADASASAEDGAQSSSTRSDDRGHREQSSEKAAGSDHSRRHEHSSHRGDAVAAPRPSTSSSASSSFKRSSTKSRPTPGMALSNAQRAKQAIVPSSGKKVTFG